MNTEITLRLYKQKIELTHHDWDDDGFSISFSHDENDEETPKMPFVINLDYREMKKLRDSISNLIGDK